MDVDLATIGVTCGPAERRNEVKNHATFFLVFILVLQATAGPYHVSAHPPAVLLTLPALLPPIGSARLGRQPGQAAKAQSLLMALMHAP